MKLPVERDLIAPASGWQTVMAASGGTVHLLDPSDADLRDRSARRALCGRREVYQAPHPGQDPLTVANLCRLCRRAASLYREPPPVEAGPDPLVRLLVIGGLSSDQARSASSIARGYLSAEFNSALARGEVDAGQRRVRAVAAENDPVALRALGAGIAWARDIVHARRTWPPEQTAAPGDG